MLTKIKLPNFKILIPFRRPQTPLRHKFQPRLFRLIHRHQLTPTRARPRGSIRVQYHLFPIATILPPPLRREPILPLRRHIRRRNNPPMWIDQEKRENFPMAGLGLVCELKRRYPMLEGIGECNQSAFVAFYASEFLRDVCSAPGICFVEAVDCLDEFVSLLFVVWFIEIASGALAEG